MVTLNPAIEAADTRDFGDRRGLAVVAEFVDVVASGSRADRPQYRKLMEAARRRKLAVALV